MDGVIEWGGYDPTNENLLNDGDVAFTINFIAKKPQDEWVVSPLYTTRKFVGDRNSKDMNITPTNGVIEVKMIQGGGFLNNINDLVIYPNPSTSKIYFNFNVTFKSNVNLSIRSMDGRVVSTVINKEMPAGNYTYFTNLERLSDGIYYATMVADGDFLVGKIVLIK
jgi:hypothetical protein